MNFKEFLVSKEVSDITKLDAEAQAGLYNEYNEASKVAIEKVPGPGRVAAISNIPVPPAEASTVIILL